MVLQNVTLISFGNFDNPFLRKIADVASNEFRLSPVIREGYLDLGAYYDAGRRQYDGNRILKTVDELYAADSSRTLGIFNVDMFIPILTFIFGQAYLNGRTGIVTVYRLLNERYGMARNDELLLERAVKEVIHELGHTMGLIHCHVPDCVMRSVAYVEDIDQKSWSLCRKCKSLISAR
jgi:archaemetzincin